MYSPTKVRINLESPSHFRKKKRKLNEKQTILNKKANVNNLINPFLTIMLHQIKKGLHQKNRKEDVSSRPHPLLFYL